MQEFARLKKPEPYKPRYPRVGGPTAVDETDEMALEAHEELLDQMEAAMAFEVGGCDGNKSMKQNILKYYTCPMRTMLAHSPLSEEP